MKGRMRMRVVLAILLTVTLMGCVELVAHQPVAPGGRYVCEDGKAFLVEFAGDGSTAAVTFDNRKVALPQTQGGTDMKYSDGRTTLYLDGPRALIETGGLVFARGCVQR
jgi:membrane-bound inhibitor of C-type lysozyme